MQLRGERATVGKGLFRAVQNGRIRHGASKIGNRESGVG
jgi:hypothetical protein